MTSKNLKKLTGYSLEDLLPHRGNMLLLDDVLAVDDEHALTEAVLEPSCPLSDENGVQPLIMVELAAQTAGICNGLTRIQEEGDDSSKLGWLVGVKRAQFTVDVIPFGQRLVVRSDNTHVFDMLREVSCVVHLQDEVIGEITLQLIQA